MQDRKKPNQNRGKRGAARLALLLALTAAMLLLSACDPLGKGRGGDGGTDTSDPGSSLGGSTTVATQNIPIPQFQSPVIPAEAGSYAYTAEAAIPSVVSITTEATVYDLYYGSRVTSGAGSGVILCEDSGYTYIVTNNHVVESYTTITVFTNDPACEGYPAEVIGTDWQSDIAVVRIAATGLKVATIGDSSSLKVGQQIAAIGNPLGTLGWTVTDGIVGCLERKIAVEGVSMTLIQHSAPVSPGNSGGGLFNLYGQLIGIVNAKSSGDSAEGLGYAIPINLAVNRAGQIINQGYVSGTPYLGLAYSSSTNGLIVSSYLYNDELTANDQDEIQKDDILYSIEDVRITGTEDLRRVLSSTEVGESLKAVILRRVTVNNGYITSYKYKEIEVNLKVHEYRP